MTTFTESYFEESQRFSPMIETALLLSSAATGFAAYYLTRGTPGAEIGLYAILAAMAFVVVLFRTFTLTTTLTGEGVALKGMWFVNRLIRYSDIASAEARQYKPIMEYGGWGYRIGPSGKAYNAQGDQGVQLVLKDGGRVLIGSQRANELAGVIAGQLRR